MSKKNVEKRSSSFQVRTEGKSEGIIEGHFVTWDKIDSYNSMFKKGAFKRSIIERGLNKIRLLWNHENGFDCPLTIIGKPLEIREDDVGVFVKAKILMDLQAGANAWRLISEGIINTLSFGFSVVEQAYDKGVRVITDVDLYEFSPVAFEANPDATITGIRADISKPLDIKVLVQDMGLLLSALGDMLNDIWWESEDNGEIPVLIDKAIDAFKKDYMGLVTQYIEHSKPETRPTTSEFAEELQRCFCGRTIVDMSQETQFTLAELRILRRGKAILQPERLKGFSENLFVLYQKNNTGNNHEDQLLLLTGVRNLSQTGY